MKAKQIAAGAVSALALSAVLAYAADMAGMPGMSPRANPSSEPSAASHADRTDSGKAQDGRGHMQGGMMMNNMMAMMSVNPEQMAEMCRMMMGQETSRR